MKPLPQLQSSNSAKLEEIKKEIKCVLIVECNRDVTLEKLAIYYKEQIGEDIPYKTFNCTSLKEFLSSIPDTVSLENDSQNRLCVRHVESGKTQHLTSLINRQLTTSTDRSSKNKNHEKQRKQCKLQCNFIDPKLLACVMSKMGGRMKKVDVLSEIKSAIGVHSFYTIQDLNAQLNELNHILIHDDVSIQLKNGEKSCRIEQFIRDSTKERLRQLAAKYTTQGIWCAQLPDVYRQEFGMDLEYKELGFNSIHEFLALLPDIFKFIKPIDSNKYKVIGCSNTTSTSTSKLVKEVYLDSVRKPQQQQLVTSDVHALPIQPLSAELINRLIPQEFMNFDDSIGGWYTNVENILKDFSSSSSLKVIVSEICSPSLFWIIMFKSQHRLVALMDSLQDFYDQHQDLDKYRVSCIVAKPGLHIACLYANQWHRGVIKTVDHNCSILTIHFYDYGTTKADYPVKQVYFLHKKFSSLPALAVPCSLHNIKPATSATETGTLLSPSSPLEWSKKAIDKFVDKALEKEFIARVFNVDRDSLTVDLLIADTSSSTQVVHMTQWMVSNNLANWGSMAKNIDSVKSPRKECSVKVYDKKFQDLGHVEPARQLEALKKYKTRFKLIQPAVAAEQKLSPPLVNNQQKTENPFQDVDLKNAATHEDAVNDGAIDKQQQQQNLIIDDRQAKRSRIGDNKLQKKSIDRALKELELLISRNKM